MGQETDGEEASNVVQFSLPQYRELDEDVEGDIYALVVFASLSHSGLLYNWLG